MEVYNNVVSCNQVESIQLFHDFFPTDALEFGWSEWSTAYTPTCSSATETLVPRRLIVLAIDDTPTCFPDGPFATRPSISAGTHDFAISNPDNNSTFNIFLDSNLQLVVDTGGEFTTGVPTLSTERDGSLDQMRGDFDSMQFQTGAGWTYWDSKGCITDNDLDWDVVNGPGGPDDVRISPLFNDHLCLGSGLP